ncbi:endonuclease/exonuclease/phosphatase family protein [Cystobacter fuscus]
MPLLLPLIARENPDVLVLQECLGWEDGERLGQVAAAMNLPVTEAHVRLGTARPRPSGNRYHVAVASRLPLRSARAHNDAHFIGHCLLECELETGTAPLTLFAAHFDSHHENLRFVEARYLRSLLEPSTFGEGTFLLAGISTPCHARIPIPWTSRTACAARAWTSTATRPASTSSMTWRASAGWMRCGGGPPLPGG